MGFQVLLRARVWHRSNPFHSVVSGGTTQRIHLNFLVHSIWLPDFEWAVGLRKLPMAGGALLDEFLMRRLHGRRYWWHLLCLAAQRSWIRCPGPSDILLGFPKSQYDHFQSNRRLYGREVRAKILVYNIRGCRVCFNDFRLQNANWTWSQVETVSW